MTIPLWVLAGLAIVGGYLGMPAVTHVPHGLNGWLGEHHGHGAVNMHQYEKLEGIAHHAQAVEWGLILLSIGVAVGGVMFAWKLYDKNGLQGDAMVQKRLGKLYTYMCDKFYVDEMYQKVFIDPFVFIGRNVIMAFDKWVIDGAVNGIGNVILFVGDTFKLMQTGFVSNYALYVVLGVMGILTYLIIG